jgi:hypothetical protein
MTLCLDHLTGALLSVGLAPGVLAFLGVGSGLGELISTGGRGGVLNEGEAAAALL